VPLVAKKRTRHPFCGGWKRRTACGAPSVMGIGTLIRLIALMVLILHPLLTFAVSTGARLWRVEMRV